MLHKLAEMQVAQINLQYSVIKMTLNMQDKKNSKMQHNDWRCLSDTCIETKKLQTIKKWVQIECKNARSLVLLIAQELFLLLLLEAVSIMNALSHMHDDDSTKENVNQWTDSYTNHLITQDIDWKAWPEIEDPALMGIRNNLSPL